MLTKENIISSLGGLSWNGTTKNRKPFTQWEATESFFSLWKEHKEAIKGLNFSLYKSNDRGWVVTLFGSHEGKYSSYREANPRSNDIDPGIYDAAQDYYDSCVRRGIHDLNEIIKSFARDSDLGKADKTDIRMIFKEIDEGSR